MITGDFKDITIDHVTPIDSTLRQLAKSLTELEKLSDIVKLYNKNQTSAYQHIIQNNISVNKTKLIKELDKIAKDSYFRPVSREANSNKSNALDYKEFFIGNNNVVHGYIDNVVLGSTNCVLYQNLTLTSQSMTPDIQIMNSTAWQAWLSQSKPIRPTLNNPLFPFDYL